MHGRFDHVRHGGHCKCNYCAGNGYFLQRPDDRSYLDRVTELCVDPYLADHYDFDRGYYDWKDIFGPRILKNFRRNDLDTTKDIAMRQIDNYCYCIMNIDTTAGASATSRRVTGHSDLGVADYGHQFALEFSKHYINKNKSYFLTTSYPTFAETSGGLEIYMVQEQDGLRPQSQVYQDVEM